MSHFWKDVYVTLRSKQVKWSLQIEISITNSLSFQGPLFLRWIDFNNKNYVSCFPMLNLSSLGMKDITKNKTSQYFVKISINCNCLYQWSVNINEKNLCLLHAGYQSMKWRFPSKSDAGTQFLPNLCFLYEVFMYYLKFRILWAQKTICSWALNAEWKTALAPKCSQTEGALNRNTLIEKLK